MQRIIVVVLLSLSLFKSGRGQQPSQQQMQAQMKQARAEARQQIDDLQKQIAEAKKNGESPETIKGLEDQLTTLNKMLGVIDQASDLNNKRSQRIPEPKTTVVVDKFISPFEPIRLNQTVKAPTNDQAKDELLWYKGKKIDAHTLITPSAMLVRYDKQRNVVIVQPDKKADTTYYGVLNILAKMGKMKNDFVFQINGILNSFLMYPEIQETYDEFDMVKDRYYDMARNVINLPPQQNNLEQLLADLTRMLNNLPDVTALSMPPERHRPICPCGSGSTLYQSNLKDWLGNKLWKEEDLVFAKYMQIYKHFEDASQKPGVAQTAILREAIKQFIIRKTQKLLNLYNAYASENIYLEDGLVLAAKSFRKQLSEIGTPFDDVAAVKWQAYDRYDAIKRSVLGNKVFTDFIDEQKQLRNHPVVLDYDFFITHELNKQLFDENYDIPYSSLWSKNIEKYNRFTLTINLDFTLEQVDPNDNDKKHMIATGALTSDAVPISLDRDGCNWSFHLTNPNHRNKSANENIFYLPFNVTGGVKDYPEDKYPPFNYSGPAKMMMVFPIFRIVFCDPSAANNPFSSPDTIIMNTLRYTDADLNSHITSHHLQTGRPADFGREYSLDMLDYVNKMFVVIKEVELNTTTFVDVTSRMLTLPDVSNLPLPTSNAILNQLFAEYKQNLARKELQFQTAENFHNQYAKFGLSKINNTLLYNQSTDVANARDKDKAYGYKLIKAIVGVKVVHTPQ